MLKQFLETELANEKSQLKKLQKKRSKFKNALLVRSNRGYFYWGERGSKKRRYIHKDDFELLRVITSSRYNEIKQQILVQNIRTLEKALKNLKNYDDPAIIESLPKAFRSALDILRQHDAETGNDVRQSENPFRREDLVITCSNGLLVRSREEAIIVEILLSLGIDFQYEKTLVLHETVTMSDGSVITADKTVYPDFTIFLADGTCFYIEHAGKLDSPGYREDFIKRFNLYMINGICSPRNLFISMASPDMPIDASLIRKVLETQILPLCTRKV